MDKKKLTESIGKNIRKHRLAKDVSQEALSLSAGLNPTYVGRLERGEKCPTIDTVYKISEALGVTVNELITLEDKNIADKAVMLRIEKALDKVPDSKHLKIAEIVENIADILVD